MPKLKNAKRERFCQEYIIDLNGTQAAIRAGYSVKTANEQAAQLLAILSVRDRVQEIGTTITDKLEITAEKVLADIEAIRLATSEGDKFNAQAALKASELQGKYLKMFTEKHELSGDKDNPIQTITRVIVDAGEK